MHARLALLLVLAFLAPPPARAEDLYPTIPDDQDQLCEVLARAPRTQVSASDRGWFERTCTCNADRVCGRAGSKRYASRVLSGSPEQQMQREAATKEAAWRRSGIQATERLRQAYRACRNAGPGTNCTVQLEALDEACKMVGIITWEECVSGR